MEEKIPEKKQTTKTLQESLDSFDWRFQTFGDSILQGMKDSAIEYLILLNKKDYRFLTFTGPTEVGKTLLLNDIKRFIATHSHFFTFDYASKDIYGKCNTFIIYRTLKEHVQTTLADTKELANIKKCGILFIEELFNWNKLNNFNEMCIEIGFDILNSRAHKAVIIDTNKEIDELEAIDTRICSRLFRDNSLVIDIPKTTTRFSKRGNSTSK